MRCNFCGSSLRVKQYLSVTAAEWPNTGEIDSQRVHACHDCTNPVYGGSEAIVAPKTATL